MTEHNNEDALIVHDFLTDIASNVSKLLSSLFAHALDARFAKPVFGTISYNDLAAASGILLITFLIHFCAGIFFRRKARIADTDSKETKRHFLRASSKPLYLFIWIFGLYFALVPLLLKWPAEAGFFKEFFDKLLDLGLFTALLWFVMRLTRILETHLVAWAGKEKSKFYELLAPLLGKSLRIIVPVVGIIFALPVLNLPDQYSDILAKGSSILIILSIAWILLGSVNVGVNVLMAKHDLTLADNLHARKMYTQVNLLGKVLQVMIGLCTIAVILMLFQQVRHIGTSLLASAGIVGIVAGIAAQQTLANLFAGFQIAFAQPIRQADVVVVEGEWGTIEEITLTYVVVHIWDDRRLILPLSYFIQKPFQNWTRASSQLLGSILIWVDYSFPVDEGRQALKPIIEGNPLWDKRFWNLQVSDASEKTMQLRILATSADSSKSWDLRCKIREDFIAYIQTHHPQSLPRLRAEMEGVSGDNQPPGQSPK